MIGGRAASRFAVTVIVAVMSVAICDLSLPASAGAYSIEGRAWPIRTLKVHPGKFPRATARAVEAWNRSGVNIRLRVVSRRSSAHVRVVTRNPGCGGGFAPVGYQGGTALVQVDRGCNDRNHFTAIIVAHELGHVLGLGHEERICALMNPSTGGVRSCRAGLGDIRCELVGRDDAKGAARIYGGRVHVKGPEICPVFAPPPQPAMPRVEKRGRSYVAIFKSPGRVRTIVPYTGLTRPSLMLEVEFARNRCPTKYRIGSRQQVGGRGGEIELRLESNGRTDFYGGPLPGRYCVVAWTWDSYNRTSKRSRPVWFTVPPPEPEQPEEEWPEDDWPEEEWPEDEWDEW